MKALSALEAEQPPISALLMTSNAARAEELVKVVERLDKALQDYGVEIRAREDQAGGKQHQWRQRGDQSEWTEA